MMHPLPSPPLPLNPRTQSIAAMHSLPTMVRSFTRGPGGGAPGGGPDAELLELVAEGSQPSDADMAAHTGLDKSQRSASVALTSISVVAGAGVEVSSRSAPSLEAPPVLRQAPSFGPRSSGGMNAFPAGPSDAVAVVLPPGGSRLARAGPASPPSAVGLARQLSPAAAAIAAAAAAAAHQSLRPSLASRQSSLLSRPTDAAPGSFSFPKVGGRSSWKACRRRM